MTDNDIRIAIAEACGWRKPDPPNCMGYMHPPEIKNRLQFDRPPDYCHDLNDMYEAEKTLFGGNEWKACDYEERLMKVTTSWAWHATARQRAEAFLRTIGKWKE